jgi:threonyl-tRNA synthetase
VQVELLPVSNKFSDYAKQVETKLRAAGIRVHLDDRNEKLQAKIRDAQLQKVPYMLILGGKEAEAGTVSVRHRAKGDLGPQPVESFLAALRAEVESRSAA